MMGSWYDAKCTKRYDSVFRGIRFLIRNEHTHTKNVFMLTSFTIIAVSRFF